VSDAGRRHVVSAMAVEHAAIRRDGAVAKFATVSGDLISHSFECKFGAAFPHAARETTVRLWRRRSIL